jgi:hypothetical protein
MWGGPIAAGRRRGTKFKLFPQPSFLQSFERAETVRVSPPAGTLGAGPSDGRMYVVDPIDKPEPYGISRGPGGRSRLYLPPWNGAIHLPVEPDAWGHFDYLQPDTPEFKAAHLYGTVRFVLDVWEDLLGRRINWHFWPEYEHLELSLFEQFDNARAGYGFLEVGAELTEDGEVRPFSLNFDIIAHEVGHLIIYDEVGLPTLATEQGEYFGFHESAADLIALVAVLHFDTVVENLLATTRGNLYTFNELNRFAELSDNEQIRLASNSYKLSDFAEGWSDEHLLAQPLTGAMFDILVDVFHELLLDRNLIAPEVEDLSDRIEQSPEYETIMQPLFDLAYDAHPDGFKAALLDARDHLGTMLALAWSRLSPHYLNYDDVGDALLDVDYELTDGRYQRIIADNFRWRDIGLVAVGPRLSPPNDTSHAFSTRTAVPARQEPLARLSYYQRRALAGRCGIPDS